MFPVTMLDFRAASVPGASTSLLVRSSLAAASAKDSPDAVMVTGATVGFADGRMATLPPLPMATLLTVRPSGVDGLVLPAKFTAPLALMLGVAVRTPFTFKVAPLPAVRLPLATDPAAPITSVPFTTLVGPPYVLEPFKVSTPAPTFVIPPL